MALETLKGVESINGHEIIRLDEAKEDQKFFNFGKFSWELFDKERESKHISITESQNMISFKIQNGPIKENGHNGVQLDDIVSTVLLMLKGLNKKFPCDHNAKAMACLYEAYTWMQQRKLDRETRGVEGQSKL